jgi:hypothetical protein
MLGLGLHRMLLLSQFQAPKLAADRSATAAAAAAAVCVIGFINTFDSQSHDTNDSHRKYVPVHSHHNFVRCTDKKVQAHSFTAVSRKLGLQLLYS